MKKLLLLGAFALLTTLFSCTADEYDDGTKTEVKKDIKPAIPAYAEYVAGKDGSGNLKGISVDANGQQKVDIFDSTGTAFSSTNPLPVSVVSETLGTEVNKYNTTASVTGGATTNHDYTITSLKTFKGRKFWASASGKIKIEVQTSPDGSAFTTYWVGFNSTANPNIDIDLSNLSITDSGAGSKIRIIVTNKDILAQDVYSTISGSEY